MKKIFSALFSKQGILIMFGCFILVYILSMINRFIQTDENWFGEHAYYLLNEGVVKLKSMPLILGYGERAAIFYKLFTFAGSALIYLFGWSVWPLKFFIFLLFLLFLYIFYKWMGSDYLNFTFQQKIIALFFLSTTPIMIEQTFIFRPEIPMMLLGFLSFIFILRAAREDNKKMAIWAGVFAGLSFLTHLNGNTIIIAGFIFLLSYKRIKLLFIYSAVAGSISLLFFYDLLDAETIKLAIYQLTNCPSNANSGISTDIPGMIVNRLMGLLSEHKRFFWSERVFSISAIFFICLIFKFKSFRKEHPDFLRYFIIFILCMNLFGSYIAERNLIYYLPFMAVIITFAISQYLLNYSKIFGVLMVFLLAFHVSTIYFKFNTVFKKNYPHVAVHNQILSKIPLHSRILAPWEFIYPGLQDYQIFSEKNIEYYLCRKIDEKEFLEAVEKLNVDYLILTERFDDYAAIDLDSIRVKGISVYSPIYQDQDYILLKR